MGLSGAGKSSVSESYRSVYIILANIFGKFISIAIGGAFDAIGHGLEGYTQNVRAVRFYHPASQRYYVLIDTPGFDDTFLSDADILIDIAKWLNTTYKRKILLKGILYLHRITDNRMSASALRNSDMFRHLCGDAGLENVILVTTMWDDVSGQAGASQDGYLDILERREAELRGLFWRSMVDHGSQTARFHHTHESAWDVLGQLKGDPRPIQLQREMVDERKPLSGTSAGAFLKTWLDVLYNHFKQGAAWLQNRLRSRTDSEHGAELGREKASVEANMKKVEAQRDHLGSHSAYEGSFAPRDTTPPTSRPNHQRRKTTATSSRAFLKSFTVRASTLPRVARWTEEIDMWGKYGSGKHGVVPSSNLGVFSNEETSTEPESYLPSPHVESADIVLSPGGPSTLARSERSRDTRSISQGLEPQEIADEESVSIDAIHHDAPAIQGPHTPLANVPRGRRPRTAALRLLEKAQSQLRSSRRSTEDLSVLKRGSGGDISRKPETKQDLPKLWTDATSIPSPIASDSSSQSSLSQPCSPFINTASSSQTSISTLDSGISMSSRITKFIRSAKKSYLPMDHSAPHSDNDLDAPEAVAADATLSWQVADPINYSVPVLERASNTVGDQHQSVQITAGEGLACQIQEKYTPELWLTPLEDIDWDMEGELIPHVSPDPQVWDIDLHPTEIAEEYLSGHSHALTKGIQV
ncbi:hypothetical protein HWV62_12346 [Athelia sp. TMB]|nr:hypothetical protein HWV62_12346 [Athelia sp. TMB]